MAEVRGIEPLFAGSKPAVLPLDDTPSLALHTGLEPASSRLTDERTANCANGEHKAGGYSPTLPSFIIRIPTVPVMTLW